ncbi:MAG: glutathione S-transferase family protein [Alphaproteobacteria bacterium]|nr:glutathione S-transferase family protein [Alphaproteobacteria bacterium]
MTAPGFVLYGWRLSWYSAKVRSYLQHKSIPYTEKKPGLHRFWIAMPRRCGDGAAPLVVTPEGEWLADSSVIIETLERRFPDLCAVPATPVQRFFSYVAETWADEFWHATALHYRFNYPGYFPQWRDEIGSLIGWAPRVLRHRVVDHFHSFMVKATRNAGATPEARELVERWTAWQLDALDRHFSTLPFLLGHRATLGDYALMGPIFGHLCWDPWPSKNLIDTRPHLKAWVARMSRSHDGDSALVAGDRIPETLQPMLQSFFAELTPYLERCADVLGRLPVGGPYQTMSPTARAAGRYPRLGPVVEVPFSGGTIRRVTLPYSLWMLQRARDELLRMSDDDAARVRGWLELVNGSRLLDIAFPRLRRIGLGAGPEITA